MRIVHFCTFILVYAKTTPRLLDVALGLTLFSYAARLYFSTSNGQEGSGNGSQS